MSKDAPTPARPALDAMAEEIERLLKAAPDENWEEIDATIFAVEEDGEIASFYFAPDREGTDADHAILKAMWARQDARIKLTLALRNNAPAISAALRSLADMRGVLQSISASSKCDRGMGSTACAKCLADAALARSAP